MRLAICRQCHVSVHQLQSFAAGECGWAEVKCDQHRCLRYSFCGEVHAQRWWAPAAAAGQATSAIRLHSRPLLVSDRKGASCSCQRADKKLWFYSLGGTDVTVMIAIRSWREVTIIVHSNDSTSTALVYNRVCAMVSVDYTKVITFTRSSLFTVIICLYCLVHDTGCDFSDWSHGTVTA